jgi:hypothetical protein
VKIFGRDVRNAMTRTPLRAVAFVVPWVVVAVIAFALGDRVEPWVWPAVAVFQFVVLSVIGSRFADGDALSAELER